MALVGGNSYKEGNVFAYNPELHIYGPVCGEDFDFDEVSNLPLVNGWELKTFGTASKILAVGQKLSKGKITKMCNWPKYQ